MVERRSEEKTKTTRRNFLKVLGMGAFFAIFIPPRFTSADADIPFSFTFTSFERLRGKKRDELRDALDHLEEIEKKLATRAANVEVARYTAKMRGIVDALTSELKEARVMLDAFDEAYAPVTSGVPTNEMISLARKTAYKIFNALEAHKAFKKELSRKDSPLHKLDSIVKMKIIET